MEKIDEDLEKVITALLPKGCNEEEHVTREEGREQDLRARNYIFASMSNELQHQHEHMTNASNKITNLWDLYGEHSRTTRYKISK